MKHHHPYLLFIFCLIIALLFMVTSSSSNVLIAYFTKWLNWPFPSKKLVLQISLWNDALLTFAFQSLSITFVKSISLVFLGSSFSHFILSTVTTPSSSSNNSCSIFLSSFTNYFFMNDWSSMSHFTCYGVGSTCFVFFAIGFIIIFSAINDGFCQFLLTGFESPDKKLVAMLSFYFQITFRSCSFISDIFCGFQSFNSLSSGSPVLLKPLNGNFLIIFFPSCLFSLNFYQVSSLPILQQMLYNSNNPDMNDRLQLLYKYQIQSIFQQVGIIVHPIYDQRHECCIDKRNLWQNSILVHYIQMLSTEVKNIRQALSSQLIPKSQQLHNHVKEFLLSQIKDFETINTQNDHVLDELKSEWDQYNMVVSELKTKKTKDTKFIEGGAGYLKAKQDQIKGKNKMLESITTGLKESVTKIKPEKLSKLPYQKEPILKEAFSTLYHVLYNEPTQKFDWSTFKKLALLHQQGEDFITRLANVNFKELSEDHFESLRDLKKTPKFIDVCENSTFAFDIVDLADWVDYVVQGYNVVQDVHKNQHDYEKIRKDIDKRSDGTLQVKQQFCSQTLRDIDSYQTNLMNLQSELRTLVIGMNHNLKSLSEIEQKRRQKVASINAI